MDLTFVLSIFVISFIIFLLSDSGPTVEMYTRNNPNNIGIYVLNFFHLLCFETSIPITRKTIPHIKIDISLIVIECVRISAA